MIHKIKIFSDYIWPFCYIGKGIVEQLKKEFQLDVTWVPYEIHPETPLEGVLLSEKFQHVDRDAMFTGLNRSGKPYDIRFNKIERLYNSRTALELSELARDKGVFDQVHNDIFIAYFHEGKNIGDLEVLCDIAKRAGLKKGDVEAILKNETYKERLAVAMVEGKEKRVSAVPTFIFSDNQTLTGAQPLEMFKFILGGGTNDSPLNTL